MIGGKKKKLMSVLEVGWCENLNIGSMVMVAGDDEMAYSEVA